MGSGRRAIISLEEVTDLIVTGRAVRNAGTEAKKST